MVLLAGNSLDIQCSLSKPLEYCNNWGLEVNVDKTIIVFFLDIWLNHLSVNQYQFIAIFKSLNHFYAID